MKRTACFCASAGCLLLLIALFSYKAFKFICVPQSYNFTFDSRCSAQFQSDVSNFVQTLGNVVTNDPVLLCEQLKRQFPIIESIQTELSSDGALSISIESANPVCTINEDIVVANPNIITSNVLYDSACIELLPHVVAAADDVKSWQAQELCNLSHALSQSLTDLYSIELVNYPELTLTNKQQPNMSLRLRADSLKADDIVQCGTAVHSLLAERGAFTGKKQKQWVADMRFSKQIVLKVY